VDGETHHVPRYRNRPNLLMLGVMPQHDAECEAVFTALAEGNGINMSAPRWAAGVIVNGQGVDGARQTIDALLTEVEVM
jgi:hypothetical protein